MQTGQVVAIKKIRLGEVKEVACPSIAPANKIRSLAACVSNYRTCYCGAV